MCDLSRVIPKETFGQLLPESQKAWSQLSDDVRVDILWALQVNGSQHSQESTHMTSLHDKPRYNQTRVPQNAMLNKTVQFNATDDDATTPSSITTFVHDISTAGTQRGEVIAIMHQYAYTGNGGTIHSSGQLKWCGNDIPLRLKVVDNDSLHQTVMSFPSTSGVVCHTSRCGPLQTMNLRAPTHCLDE
jgi:hypothetical protein